MRLAILDMYNGETNLGLKSIIDLVSRRFPQLTYEVFDVRQKQQIPDLSFDIFISSGGPNHPLHGEELWGEEYFRLLDQLYHHNSSQPDKKFAFFICHSFQIACHHFGIGKVIRRPRESFGIFPIRKTEAGIHDPLFQYLPDPFYAADFRKYQIIRPNFERIQALGCRVLAIEHEAARLPHSEPALMAFRLGETMLGTQFHPEAYPEGMLKHFSQPDRRIQIIETHGATVYESMLFHLRDPIKLNFTHEKVLPEFLRFAVKSISSRLVPT